MEATVFDRFDKEPSARTTQTQNYAEAENIGGAWERTGRKFRNAGQHGKETGRVPSKMFLARSDWKKQKTK